MSAMTEKEFLEKARQYRNKMVGLMAEGKQLADEGQHLTGKYAARDFDGDDISDDAQINNIGDALAYTDTIEETVAALFFFLDCEGR